tara:strand:+ start:276 stop:542 length:267 start_codon:yes stop_codon:yes gene_type:complete
MQPIEWYQKAKQKIESFLPELDPNLEVDVDTTTVTPNQGDDQYTTFVLVFSHQTNSNLQWTMEVEEEDFYIENELEKIVKEIYFQRVE